MLPSVLCRPGIMEMESPDPWFSEIIRSETQTQRTKEQRHPQDVWGMTHWAMCHHILYTTEIKFVFLPLQWFKFYNFTIYIYIYMYIYTSNLISLGNQVRKFFNSKISTSLIKFLSESLFCNVSHALDKALQGTINIWFLTCRHWFLVNLQNMILSQNWII
jgi:hypothetical protein